MAFDKDNPLEPITGADGRKESRRANQAFRDYCYMGSARSLRKLLAQYQARVKKKEKPAPPTDVWTTVSDWSGNFSWTDRSKAFDRYLLDKDKRAYEERRRVLLETGLALDFERVGKLKELFDKLEGYLGQEDRIWLKDVKSIGFGKDAEKVDIIRFNSPMIEQIRGVLDDIAREVGGRVKNVDVKTAGRPLEADDSKYDRAISTLADALGEILSGPRAEPDGPVGPPE